MSFKICPPFYDLHQDSEFNLPDAFQKVAPRSIPSVKSSTQKRNYNTLKPRKNSDLLPTVNRLSNQTSNLYDHSGQGLYTRNSRLGLDQTSNLNDDYSYVKGRSKQTGGKFQRTRGKLQQANDRYNQNNWYDYSDETNSQASSLTDDANSQTSSLTDDGYRPIKGRSLKIGDKFQTPRRKFQQDNRRRYGQNHWNDYSDEMSSQFNHMIDSIGEDVDDIYQRAQHVVKNRLNQVNKTSQNLLTDLSDTASDFYQSVSDSLSRGYNRISQNLIGGDMIDTGYQYQSGGEPVDVDQALKQIEENNLFLNNSQIPNYNVNDDYLVDDI